MMKTLRSQHGNIAIALALTIVGIMSGITLASLALKDTVEARLDFDGEQELHLIRSEVARGQYVVQVMDYKDSGFSLPARFAKVVGTHAKNTYKLSTKIAQANISTGGGLYFTSGYTIKTLAQANRGASYSMIFGRDLSMVKKFGQKDIRRNSFAGYHYFTDNDQSTNGTPVYFWGPDVIYGKVHSNSDIWLKQAGGGNNNGWPTFMGPVYTAGQIQSFSGPPPAATVFRAGYWEHVSRLDFNPTADLIRARGTQIGPSAPDPMRIAYVTIHGEAYDAMQLQIINAGPDTADVWTQYPPRNGTYMFRNRYNRYDTLWTPMGTGNGSGHSNIVFSKLWLRTEPTGGQGVSGKQTWCSTDTLYLNDDIKLAHTALGAAPDGDPNTGLGRNTSDYMGIVSEKSILIQYGYADTIGGRFKPNCDGHIYIYAALCALGSGNGNSHQDGVFTFEYQHPHPSVPAVRLGTNPYVWDKIDIHRRRYPQQGFTWPGNIDYPWYNPLWPERYPWMERGTIHLYGSVAQRRRGFVHRNTADSEYPNPNGIWNIPMDLCGGTSGAPYTDPILGFGMQGVNSPQATGGGVGYSTKDYHFDNRFSFVTPPDFPEVHVSGGVTPFEGESLVFRRPSLF